MKSSSKWLFLIVIPILSLTLLLPLAVAGRSHKAVAPISKSNIDVTGMSQIQREATESVANCRYGVTTKNGTDQVDWVDDFGAGWFLDFQFDSPPAANGAEFVAMIYTQQDKDNKGNYLPTVTMVPPLTNEGLGLVIDRYPGRLWIIGNEPDRGPALGNPTGVGDTYPDAYARAYHDAYHFIKERDPSALVGIAGLVEVTPGRLNYLDQVWDYYLAVYQETMPVDVWTMHLYILPEVTWFGEPNDIASVALGTDPALGIRESQDLSENCVLDDVYCISEHDSLTVFEEQVVAMRNWMADHNQRQKPLIITEYSILYPYFDANGTPCGFKDEDGECFSPQRVADFMGETFTYLEGATNSELGYSLDEDRLVQQWLWYSVYRRHLGHASNLITGDVPAQLTPAGAIFQQTTLNSTLTVNLLPGDVSNPVQGTGSGSTTATLTVAVHNNGTQRVDGPFEVAFYRDSKLHHLIGTATVPGPDGDSPGLTGCATRYITTSVEWPGLTPGEYPFWVKIDYLDTIPESDEEDNITTGIVRILPAGVFLPLTVR